MAFCAINMSVENRRDFGAIAMLLHMILAGAGAILVCCYFVIRNLLDELNGLLRKHYSKTTLYLESVLVIGLLMILIHGYGVKVRVAMWSRSVSTSRSRPITASVSSRTDCQTTWSRNRGSLSWYRSQTVRLREHPWW